MSQITYEENEQQSLFIYLVRDVSVWLDGSSNANEHANTAVKRCSIFKRFVIKTS